MIIIYAIVFLFGYLLTGFIFHNEEVFSEKTFAVIFAILIFSSMVYINDLLRRI